MVVVGGVIVALIVNALSTGHTSAHTSTSSSDRSAHANSTRTGPAAVSSGRTGPAVAGSTPARACTTAILRPSRPGGGGRHRLRLQLLRRQGVPAGRRHRPPALGLHHRRSRRSPALRSRAAPSTSAAWTTRSTRWTPPPAACAGPTPPGSAGRLQPGGDRRHRLHRQRGQQHLRAGRRHRSPSLVLQHRSFVYSSPAVADDRLHRQRRRQGVRAGRRHRAPPLDLHHRSWPDSSPAVAGGTVYIGSDDGKVYALDAATGRLRWAYTTAGPSIQPGGGGRHRLHRQRRRQRCTRWTPPPAASAGPTPPEATCRLQPAVAGGTVYVGSDDDNVYALDAATGHLRWTYTTEVPCLQPGGGGGTVYAGSAGARCTRWTPPPGSSAGPTRPEVLVNPARRWRRHLRRQPSTARCTR